MRRALLIGLAALVVVGAAVGVIIGVGRRPAPAPDAPTPYGQILTATLTLPRLPTDPLAVWVLVTNHGDRPVHVVQVELLSDSFVSPGPTELDVTIPPGRRIGLPVDYGPGRCNGQAAPSLAPTSARILVADGDAREAVEFALPDAEYEGLGTRLHVSCAAQIVSATVDLHFAGWSTAPDGTLVAALVVQRRAGDELIALHSLRGSVLFNLAEPATDPWGVLQPGSDDAEFRVAISPQRCDAHALADVKFPYDFWTWITLGDGVEEIPAQIATDTDGQTRLVAMWHTVCGV